MKRLPPMLRLVVGSLLMLSLAGLGRAQEGGKDGPPAAAEIDAAIKQIEDLEQNAEFNKARILAKRLETRLGGHARLPVVRELCRRLLDEDEAATDLEFAVKQLTEASATARRVAEKKIMAAGSAGRIVLRKVMRDKDPQLAPIAARLLATVGDQTALPLLFERVAQKPASPEAKALLPFVGRLLEHLTPAQFAQIYGWLKTEKNARFELKEFVAFFAKVFRERCGGDKEKFNKLLNDPLAFNFLSDYVQAACMDKDPDLNAWAMTEGSVFSPMVPGLRGAYYLGTNFEKLAFERLDEKIDIPDRKFPYPDNTQDNISIRWTGFVFVKTPGKYTFYSASDDGQRVWVDDKPIINDWAAHGVLEVKGEIELTAGLHPYKVEFYQGQGGASITEWWSGPGIERQVLGKDVLRVTPWPGMAGLQPAKP